LGQFLFQCSTTNRSKRQMNVLPKMSIKTLGCKPHLAKDSDKPVALARIMGIANGVKWVEGQGGELSPAILGAFEGVNLQTGEVYQSGKLFLPGGIAELISGQFKTDDDKNKSVQFAFDISSVAAKNPIGYSYQAKQLTKPAENDPLALLRKEMPALPAPTKDDAKGGKKAA
jgi:hypothetical protein